MSTTLTLTDLRTQIGVQLGESDITGNFTSTPNGTTLLDNNRYDADNIWQNAFIQDISASPYPITRIQAWTQGNTSFTLFKAFGSGAPANGDSYELHRALSFFELRQVINRGISTCGQGLRTLVRDETQSLIAGQYQYLPNYSAATPNAYFPQGVVKVEVQYYTGLPTAPWLELTDWEYLDDFTLQLTQDSVDAYAGNQLRFTGYGPVTGRITNDNPYDVIGTFDDDFQIEALTWACTYHGWLMLAAKKTTGEGEHETQMSQIAFQNFDAARKQWQRPQVFKKKVKGALPPGWST